MAKKNTNRPPRFVNMAVSIVTVFDETRRNVRVAPWHMRDRDHSGIFVVEGAHYQQFVSGRGPLHPFPAGEALPLSGTVDPLGKRVAAQSPEARDIGTTIPRGPAPGAGANPTTVPSGQVDGDGNQDPEDTEDDEEGAGGDDAGAGGEDTGDGDPDADGDDVGGEGEGEEVGEGDAAPGDGPKRTLADRVLGRNKLKDTPKSKPKKKAAKKKTAAKKKGG